jgi:hypothetical protein
MSTTRPVLATLAAAATGLVVLAPVASTTPTAHAAGVQAAVPFDLNGDGRVDVVSGLPNRTVPDSAGTPVRSAGAVLVLWGGRNRLPETLITRADDGVPGELGYFDSFGTSLASADFDRDGYADLAVGTPYPGYDGAGYGEVLIFFGAADRNLTRRVALVPRGAHAGFGASLVAADLDRDSWPDLAVGANRDDPRVEEDYGTGAVVVLSGGPAGFAIERSAVIARPQPSTASFGTLLAAGDLDGDGDLDLVEGYRGTPRWIDDPPVPGHVTYALGSPDGFGPAVQLTSRSATSLAVGDLTGDGRDDVVVGSAFRTTWTEDDPTPRGRVTIFRGLPTGPSPTGSSITQATRGVPGSDERGDQFGASVTLTDVDRDDHLDLVVGAPGENAGRGRVTILRGNRRGVATRDAVTLDQASPEIPGRPEKGDLFGAAVAALDVNGDGRRDLVLGAPGENRSRGTLTVVELRGIFYVGRGVRSYSLASIGAGGRGLGAVIGD